MADREDQAYLLHEDVESSVDDLEESSLIRSSTAPATQLRPVSNDDDGWGEPTEMAVFDGREKQVEFRSRLPTATTAESRYTYNDFSAIDWVRDASREQFRKRTSVDTASWQRRAYDASQGWLLMLLIGLACGTAAGIVDIGAEWLTSVKEGYCPGAFWLNKKQCCWAEDLSDDCELWVTWSEAVSPGIDESSSGAYVLRMLFYALFGCLFAWVVALLVKIVAPYASGSGVPEVKTILSGFIIQGYFGLNVLAVKAIGVVLAVSAGLSMGKEGPLVHVACCCGNFFANLFEKYRINEAKRREVLSAACAAGVSVAFGAPIGGVLFSLEEVSYYFPHKTLWRAFFAALVADATLAYFNPFLSGHLVKFYVEYDYPWHWFEAIPFLLIGVFGGLYGALFATLNIWWCSKRKHWKLLRDHPIREVVCVALVTLVLCYPNPLSRISKSELIHTLFAECRDTDNSFVCRNDDSSSIYGLLVAACILQFGLTVFTFGIKVPAGLFVPTMVVGATFGRLIGIATESIVLSYEYDSNSVLKDLCPDITTCITPGLYAMVGAAATLGGVTRMTVSLVVIMFELTGGLFYIVPIMIAVVVSKWVADAFNKEGIYDRHIHLNDYPFLDDKEEFGATTIARDMMSKIQHIRTRAAGRPGSSASTSSVDWASNSSVIFADKCTVSHLETLLEETTFQGFPLVTDAQHMQVLGFVGRKELQDTIDNMMSMQVGYTSNTLCSFESPDLGGPKDSSMLDLFDTVQQNVFQIPDVMPSATVVELFRRMGIRQALVTTHGKLVGMITKKDVIRHVNKFESHH